MEYGFYIVIVFTGYFQILILIYMTGVSKKECGIETVTQTCICCMRYK